LQGTGYTSKNPTSESAREIFRQCLRQADKFIIEGNFEQAKIQLAEAKKIDSRNPFIIAFEERIALFENKVSSTQNNIPADTLKVEKKKETKPPQEKIVSESTNISKEQLEQNLRQQIEAEFKLRYTQELRKAEEQAAKILNEEREKLEQQKQILKTKFEHQLEEARKQLDIEYKQKLDQELIAAEERLEKKHQAELAFVENEMKSQLMKQYEDEIQNLQNQLRQSQDERIENERKAFKEKEQALKDEFNKTLAAELQRVENVFKEEQKSKLQLLEKEVVERKSTKKRERSLKNVSKN